MKRRFTYPQLPPCIKLLGDNRVRKTSVLWGPESFKCMEMMCNHLIFHPDPMIVPVYSFTKLPTDGSYFHYSYDMKRLTPLSDEESNITWDVGNARLARAANPTRKFNPDAEFPVEYAWEKHPKLMSFLEEVALLNRYHDIHGENIMLDEDGSYRLVDLEAFINPPLESPINDWFRYDACQLAQESNSL